MKNFHLILYDFCLPSFREWDKGLNLFIETNGNAKTELRDHTRK